MPDPQKKMEGIKNIAIANCLCKCGYILYNARNKAHIPLKDNKAKKRAITEYVWKLNKLKILATLHMKYDGGSP
jgi:hypothetical protein